MPKAKELTPVQKELHKLGLARKKALDDIKKNDMGKPYNKADIVTITKDFHAARLLIIKKHKAMDPVQQAKVSDKKAAKLAQENEALKTKLDDAAAQKVLDDEAAKTKLDHEAAELLEENEALKKKLAEKTDVNPNGKTEVNPNGKTETNPKK